MGLHCYKDKRSQPLSKRSFIQITKKNIPIIESIPRTLQRDIKGKIGGETHKESLFRISYPHKFFTMSTQSKTYSNYQTQRIISVTHPEPAHLPSSPHHTASMMSFDIEKPDHDYENTRSSREYRTVRIPIIKKDVRKSWAITGIVLLCIVLGLVIIGVAVGTTSKSDPELPRPTDRMDPVPNSATAGRPVI